LKRVNSKLLLNLYGDRHGAGFGHRERKHMAFSKGSPFVSQSFSQTQTVSHDNQAESSCVEVTRVWSCKTAGPQKFDPTELPYGPTDFGVFGPQYGMAISKWVEPIESPYGEAEVTSFGPQYGIAALSRKGDVYNDSDEDGRSRPKIKKAATVQLEDLNSLKVVSQIADSGTAYTEERRLEVQNTNAHPETKQPTNDFIPESWICEYDTVSKKYDIADSGSPEQTKPEAKAMAARVSDLSLPSQIDALKWWEIDETVMESTSSSKLHQPMNGTSLPRTPEKTPDIPMNLFADPAVAEANWDIYGYSDDETDILVTPKTGPTSCIVCTDDFSATLKPPGWISISCLHEPSVCCECLARWIKSDLESKIWNQITCPECKTLLVYEDIQRLADPETFAKYANLNIRI
jgi:hypothetical protein